MILSVQARKTVPLYHLLPSLYRLRRESLSVANHPDRMTSKPRRYKKMTDITNTNIKAKSGALSTDYKELKTEVMKLQKKGLPFMLTSVVIWTAITIVRTLPVDIMTKNLYTFYCT